MTLKSNVFDDDFLENFDKDDNPNINKFTFHCGNTQNKHVSQLHPKESAEMNSLNINLLTS